MALAYDLGDWPEIEVVIERDETDESGERFASFPLAISFAMCRYCLDPGEYSLTVMCTELSDS